VTTTVNIPPTTVPTQPATGPEPGFVTTDDEVEVFIQGVDENEVPSLVNPEGRLVLTAGNFLKVRGRGFTNAGTAEVWLFSTPQLLGRVPKDDSGNFVGRVRIPAGIESGEHTVELRAKTRRGRNVLVSVPAIVIGATRLELEFVPEDDNGGQSVTTLGGSDDQVPGEETKPKAIEIEPGATEVAVPIDVIVEVVISVLPTQISPSETDIEVRTNSVDWQPVNLESTEPVILPLSDSTTAVDVQATAKDGRVFAGSIPVAVRTSNDLARGLGAIVLIIAIGILALWFVAWRQRRAEENDTGRS
jgi:hypothetical protein